MLIDRVKTALRIRHNELDADINQHIFACIADLKRVGVAVPENPENVTPLLETAIKIYLMAQYDFLGKGPQYKIGYETLRDGLSLSAEYSDGKGVD